MKAVAFVPVLVLALAPPLADQCGAQAITALRPGVLGSSRST
jgi:hypothetical protein